MTYDKETEAEIAHAIELGRAKRRSATAETAPAQVQESIAHHLSPLRYKPDERLLHLEILSLTARRLPDIQKDLGRSHPLSKEWLRVHRETIKWLASDSIKRHLEDIRRS